MGEAAPRGRAAWVDLDLAALRHNLAVARKFAPRSQILAAVKADGYGHGLLTAARALRGADALGVASIDEALELRDDGIQADITLLEGFFSGDELPQLVHHRVDTVVHHFHQLELLEGASLGGQLRVWLKVNTGMHRLGFGPACVADAYRRLMAVSGVQVMGFLTHLANADDIQDPFTLRQLALFQEATAPLPGQRSIANSAGLLGWPASHAEWVRPGIMLYGVSPFPGERAEQYSLKPVMTLRSELIAVNWVKQGERIGYGGSWTCPVDMPVGVVAIGYGDGYPRHAPSGTPVLVNGKRVPLVGRVSMDMITVDLRQQPEAQVGAPVVLWGDGLPVEEVAEQAGTIAYELFCGVTGRVKRVMLDTYLDDETLAPGEQTGCQG